MHPLISIIASLLELKIFLFIQIEFVPSYRFSYTKTYIQLVSRAYKFYEYGKKFEVKNM